jgi:phage baseplate assembly protein V
MSASGMLATLQAVKRRVAGMLVRGILRAAADDGGLQLVTLDLLHGEAKGRVQRFQDYGFTSHPLAGAEALAGAVGGDRAHLVAIRIDDRRYRLALSSGEVALYDDLGQFVKLGREGLHLSGQNVLIETDGVARIAADQVEIRGETSVQTEVYGKGERRSHLGGADYELDRYVLGASETANDLAIDQPDLPSDHPSSG